MPLLGHRLAPFLILTLMPHCNEKMKRVQEMICFSANSDVFSRGPESIRESLYQAMTFLPLCYTWIYADNMWEFFFFFLRKSVHESFMRSTVQV